MVDAECSLTSSALGVQVDFSGAVFVRDRSVAYFAMSVSCQYKSFPTPGDSHVLKDDRL